MELPISVDAECCSFSSFLAPTKSGRYGWRVGYRSSFISAFPSDVWRRALHFFVCLLAASHSPGAVVSLDDGYFTAGEIEQIELKTDFVNLSACETGLGKIYPGEGVVGLAQAFILAGSKTPTHQR